MEKEVVEIAIKQIDIYSLYSSSISIVLAIVAIALSIVFYRMSDKNAKEAERSSNNIKNSVEKLEILFEKLYSGTFNIVQETVSDMRKHVYSRGVEKDEISKEIEEKTTQAITDVVNEIKSNQKSEEELKELIHSVINKSKEVEEDVKANVLRKEIIEFLKRNGESTFPTIKEYLSKKGLVPEKNGYILFKELKELADDNIINNPFEKTSEGYDSLNHGSLFHLL